MKYFYKVFVDFTNFIPIDETELEKALYAFLVGKPAVFQNGAANRIENIIPDWNAALGWNSGYKPQADDWADIDRIKPKYSGHIGKIKEKIQYLISTGKTNLIGKNVDIPELDAPKDPELSKLTRGLAAKMKLN